MEEAPVISGIDGLPDEVLEKILLWAPTKDLLHSARLVSRRWNRISSSISRQRFVKLAVLGREVRPVFDVFTKDSVDLPWSSITFIDTEAELGYFPTVCKQQFLEIFGHQLKKLRVKTRPPLTLPIPKVLELAPNLQYLDLDWMDGENSFTTEKFMKVNLPFLKTLKMMICDDGAELFCFLVRSCAYLKKVKLHFPFVTSVASAAKCFSLLTGFRNVSLSICTMPLMRPEYLHANAILDMSPKLRKLTLRLREPPPPPGDPTYFSSLEAILIKSADTLRSLKLRCEYNSGRSKTPLKFPVLPALKVLKVEFLTFDILGNDIGRPDFLPHFFSTVTTEHFPVLEKFKIDMHFTLYGHSHFQTSLFDRHSEADQCRFAAVKELEVNTCRITDDWSAVFPGLLRLKVKVENYRFLSFIFLNMVNLEHLDLSFSFNPDRDGEMDLNRALSGLDNYCDQNSCLEPQPQQARQCECLCRNRRYPSILSLQALKSLELSCPDGRTRLTDAGADLALLHLQPLHKLCLRNQNLSELCVARLKERHHQVEVIND